MGFNFDSHYKVLKDETNQKILEVINENNKLSYTDLIEKSEICSEGLLNYHLRALGDLIRKNEENQYVLTEKGQSALKILKEKPEQLKKFERKRLKHMGYALVLGYVIIFIVVFVLYYQGYLSLGILRKIGMPLSIIAIFYIGYVVRVSSLLSEKAKKKRIIIDKLLCTVFGGIAGLFILMMGTLIATAISIRFDGPNFLQATSSNTAFFYSYLSIAVVIGCITGYYIGKKLTKTNFRYTML